MFDEHEAESAVVTVGDGRGFVIKHRHDRLVVTAAHCLPRFPPCHGASYLEERTYSELLAPLGDDLAVWAECLFADPIADIAVLGSPDDQELTEAAGVRGAGGIRDAALDCRRPGRGVRCVSSASGLSPVA
jgi:hypothetical protein